MPESQIQVKLNPDTPPTGSDLSVVNAARRSFGKRSEAELKVVDKSGDCEPRYYLKDKDKRLIEFLARGMTTKDWEQFVEKIRWEEEIYLYEDLVKDQLWKWRNTPTHETPFNHTFISFEVKAPIFVARQLVKHEYLLFSEFSRRYITDDVEFYRPDYFRKAAEDKKQGSTKEPVMSISGDSYWGFGLLSSSEKTSLQNYKDLISANVCPEQARMVLPQSLMTEWTWSGTIGAFAKMCRERLHPDAQYESRRVAKQVYEYLKAYYPVSSKALVEGV